MSVRTSTPLTATRGASGFGIVTQLVALVLVDPKAGLKAAFEWAFGYGSSYDPRRGARRVLSGQGITGETQAIIAFFALLVIGVFVLGQIDTNLDTSSLDTNYSGAANQTSGGFLDYVNLAIVLPIVVVGGLMLSVILRVF